MGKGPFKMKKWSGYQTSPVEQEEEIPVDAAGVATEGEYKGQKIFKLTGKPKGTSEVKIYPPDVQAQIDEIRLKLETVKPFSDEEVSLREDLNKLRKSN